MKNLKTQGFILIDVDVAALNNAGKSLTSNFDNAVATKTITKNGKKYAYVSGQAWRHWWRITLQKQFVWKLSPITREKKVAFTDADPVEYADDDIFGYMRAAKAPKLDEKGEVIKDKKGNPKLEDVTVTRISPLKNSAIVSVASVATEENWSSMARQEGDSVPYSKEEYSAIMKGMFALDLTHSGTFSNYDKTGYKNLTDTLQEKVLKMKGSEKIDDPFVQDSEGKPQKLIRLPKEVRKKRISDTIKALKFISGGAMQTSNMADVAPKFIILSTMSVGNHPFTHVVNSGINQYTFNLNIKGFEEILNDFKKQFEGNVYVGVRNGFLDRLDMEELEALEKKYGILKLKTINEAIDAYCKDVQKLIE